MDNGSHIRCVLGDKVYYLKRLDCVATVVAVYDQSSSIMYDVQIPFATMPEHSYIMRNVRPEEIRIVEEISLP